MKVNTNITKSTKNLHRTLTKSTMPKKGSVCKSLYDEVVAENKRLKDALNGSAVEEDENGFAVSDWFHEHMGKHIKFHLTEIGGEYNYIHTETGEHVFEFGSGGTLDEAREYVGELKGEIESLKKEYERYRFDYFFSENCCFCKIDLTWDDYQQSLDVGKWCCEACCEEKELETQPDPHMEIVSKEIDRLQVQITGLFVQINTQKKELESLKKSNKQKTKIIHKIREQLPPEITYKETTNGAKEGKCEKNTVYYDFNEGREDYYGDKKPVSIYWDSTDDRVDDYMNAHYNYRGGGDDWSFLKPIKDKFWKKGKRLCFWTKTNADGYFNIWFIDDAEGTTFYQFINEDGFLYSSVHKYECDIPCKFNEVE